MDSETIAVRKELRNLENDKKMTQLAIKNEQNKIAEKLKGSMGNDMEDVLSGKTKVKLSFFERLKYKINFWLDKFFRMF